MKPIFIKTTTSPDHSFTIEEHKGARFSQPYHFHPEYELTLITKGWGTRFIGNNISSFTNSDLVLIGSNLPHHWKCDTAYDHPESGLMVRAIVLKFGEAFNHVKLFDLPEHYQINKLLNKASHGLKITGSTLDRVYALLEAMLEATGADRIILLLSILSEIAESKDIEALSNSDYTHHINANEMDRMNNVYEYILKHYLAEINLNEAAKVANMHVSAFCKYFKKRYGKTFIQVVNEIRISQACRSLLNDDINVAQACYQSGFNNLSNFTKTFRKVTGLTPKEYQKTMAKKSSLTPLGRLDDSIIEIKL